MAENEIIAPQLPLGGVAVQYIRDIAALSDEELTARLRRINSFEKGAEAALVAHLAEFDSRRLYRKHGYGSLFTYCARECGQSESSAYKRIQAARAVRSFPVILDRLAIGRVHVSAVAVLAPHFTEENVEALLSEAEGKTKYELERMAARLKPKPDRKDVMMTLPGPPPASSILPASDLPGTTLELEAEIIEEPSPARQRIEPLSEDRVHFGFTGSERLRGKIERVKELLWHSDPAGRLESLVETLADFYLDRKDPSRRLARRERQAAKPPCAAVPAPAASAPDCRPRYIPQSVKDSVWLRDGGSCAFLAPDGSRCSERAGLEYDHVTPYALGGRSDDPANVRLLCRAHNQWEAQRRGLDRPREL